MTPWPTSGTSRRRRAAAGRTAVLPFVLLVAVVAMLPSLALANQREQGLRMAAVDGVVASVVKPDGTPIVGTTTVGRMQIVTPVASPDVYTGYCVDPDRAISVGSDYDVVLQWDASSMGGFDDLPALNGRRDEVGWLLYNTEDLAVQAPASDILGRDPRNVRMAAIQVALWQQLGLAHPTDPVPGDPALEAEIDAVNAALGGRSGNVARSLSVRSSTPSASVCGTTATVTLTVTGTPNSTATVEITRQPSPQTAALGGPGVTVDPTTGVATLNLGDEGRRVVTLTGATPGQVEVKVRAHGVEIVHWRDRHEASNGADAVQRGVFGAIGAFSASAVVTFTGCLQAPVAQTTTDSTTVFERIYVPTTTRLSVAHSGPKTAVSGRKVRYRVKVRNVGGRLARRVVLRYGIPRGFAPSARREAGLAALLAKRPPSGRTLRLAIGDLRPGQTATIQIRLLIDPRTLGRKQTVAVVSADNAARILRRATTRVKLTKLLRGYATSSGG